jgi:hypothetical protein
VLLGRSLSLRGKEKKKKNHKNTVLEMVSVLGKERGHTFVRAWEWRGCSEKPL